MKITRAQANDSNPFSSESAGELMAAVIRSLNATGRGWTLADVVHILGNPDYTAEVLARSRHDTHVGEDEAPRV